MQSFKWGCRFCLYYVFVSALLYCHIAIRYPSSIVNYIQPLITGLDLFSIFFEHFAAFS